MTIEEMQVRRDALAEWGMEMNHSIWNDRARGALIEHWVLREIARYDNKIARRLAEIGW